MPCSASRHFVATATAAAALLAPAVQAADLNTLQNLNQAQFRLLAEDIGSLATYKPLIPAEATGITGFDLGGAAGVSQIKNKGEFQIATNNEDPPGTLNHVSFRANKGLPFDFDIGGSATTVLDTNVQVYGADVRWAAVLGGALIPAVSLRLAFSTISGVDQLDLDTVSYDISLSKGFAFMTPYVGLGLVQVKATPINVGLQAEKFNLTRLFAGTNVALGLMNFIVEVDKTGDAAHLGMKVGIRF
jgi:opacity protein-like surface antigen